MIPPKSNKNKNLQDFLSVLDVVTGFNLRMLRGYDFDPNFNDKGYSDELMRVQALINRFVDEWRE